jgi:CO/xanthine dehydrogenase Mo-binding subunit
MQPFDLVAPAGIAEAIELGAAIANAVHHATGRRIRDLPIRPEMLT